MKKRILSVFLTLCMVLTLAPAALATGGDSTDIVAKVGGTDYTTLAAAVGAIISSESKPGTVVLQKKRFG